MGLPSHASLFRIQAERLRRVAALAKADSGIPWLVMTSPQTDADTRAYFEAENYLGTKQLLIITKFRQNLLTKKNMHKRSFKGGCDLV